MTHRGRRDGRAPGIRQLTRRAPDGSAEAKTPVTTRLPALLDARWFAVVISAVYPTVFTLSNNWYAVGASRIRWLLTAAVVSGLAISGVVELLLVGLGRMLRAINPAAGRCDALIYPGVTPVNIMGIVFDCLAGAARPREELSADVSLFLKGGQLWLTARDGRALPRWERYHAP